MREKINGARDALGARAGDVVNRAPVVVHGGADVPSVDPVCGPRCAVCRGLMDNGAAAGRSKRGGIKIK